LYQFGKVQSQLIQACSTKTQFPGSRPTLFVKME
jgi:hypothetical protein